MFSDFEREKQLKDTEQFLNKINEDKKSTELTKRELKEKISYLHKKLKRINNLSEDTENAESDELYDKFYEPEEGNPKEDVYYENFVWNRKKSNENIKDTGAGKGFSFYYAAQVWQDDDHCTIKNKNNKEHPDYDVTLGLVATKDVVVVVNTKLEDGKIRIVSAWEDVNAGHYTDTYLNHINNKKKNESAKPKEYLLLRRADGNLFYSNSKGKIINSDDLDFPSENSLASYKGKKVFIQKRGTLESCKHLQNVIDAYLKYAKTGFDW